MGLSERQRGILKTLLKILLVLAVLLLILTKLVGFFAPFVIAFLIALIIEKPVKFFMKKLSASRSVSVAISLVLFLLLSGAIIGFIFYQLFIEIWDLASNSSAIGSIIDQIKYLLDFSGDGFYANIPEPLVNAITSGIERFTAQISSSLGGWLNTLLAIMLNIVQSVPKLILYIIITITATYFMSRDRALITNFIYRQIPSWKSKMSNIKNDVLGALLGYFKAMLKLTFIAFIQVSIGYIILGVEYWLILAIITAIADIIPVLGPGTILIPASIISLIMGDGFKALGFIILYAIVTIVRQALQPRILGENIGLNPLVTLLAMFIGYKIFGVGGMILGPVFAVCIKALQKVNILPKWK